MNLILWSTQRKLIEDIEAFHRVKSTFSEFWNRMELLVSLMEFVERFGANTQRIHEEMGDLEEMYREATGLYLDQDFQGCEDTMRSTLERFSETEAEAKKVKDGALIWVYVIEWMVTTSTIFLSSFALWTLMVRRRLYRVPRTTRLT